MNNIYNLIRKNILLLEPYQSANKLGGKGNIWLNANEYPITTKYKLKNLNLNRYPVCQPKKLINRYANYSNINPKKILVCRGADEGIDLLMRAFCEPQYDSIMFCPPTYGMYKTNAESLNINYYAIKTKENWQLDLLKISKNLNKVKLIYICHPNNPTGNIIDYNDIKKLLNIINNNSILVVDEAYIDFSIKYSLISLLHKNSNLVILRTLSKAFALAGLRCGFILANQEIIKLLLKIISPYPLPLPTIDIAEQALNYQGIKKHNTRISRIKINKDILMNELSNCICVNKVYPSFGNYILVKFYPKYKVFKKLWNDGTILRDQSKQLGLDNCLRITIGTKKECKNLILKLKKIN